MFGGGDRIAERGVHHNDAARGCRRNVDIVDADAGAADHFEPLGVVEELARYLGCGADREPIETIDGGGKFFFVLAEIRREFDIEAAILENRHGGRRQRIGNKDSRRHSFALLTIALDWCHAAAASAALALA